VLIDCFISNAETIKMEEKPRAPLTKDQFEAIANKKCKIPLDFDFTSKEQPLKFEGTCIA